LGYPVGKSMFYKNGNTIFRRDWIKTKMKAERFAERSWR